MTTQQSIIPNLWFDGNAEQAVEFYVSVFKDVFGDAHVKSVTHYPTEGLLDFQQDMAGKALTVEFELRGQHFTAINAGPEFHFTEALSLAVMCDTQEQIDRLWEAFSAVPESEACGWCKDKYGLSWQIVPTNMDALMASPGAYQRMMTMKKLDIEALRG